MSFAKFLEGALQGATEAMPAAFQRHADRQRFEEQMQLERQQFTDQMQLERDQFGQQMQVRDKELAELQRHNQVLEGANADQLEFDRSLADAEQRNAKKEFLVGWINGTKNEAQLDAVTRRLDTIEDPKLRGLMGTLIESHRQGLTHDKTQAAQDLFHRLTYNGIENHLKRRDYQGAAKLANSLPQGQRGPAINFVTLMSEKGLSADPDAERRGALFLQAELSVQEAQRTSMKPLSVSEFFEARAKVYTELLGVNDIPIKPPTLYTDRPLNQPPPVGDLSQTTGIAAPDESAIPAILPGDATGGPIGDKDVQSFAGRVNTGPRPEPITMFEGALPSNFDNPYAGGVKPVPEEALWGIGGP